MKIVVADDLPASALALLNAEDRWVVDARPGRKADALAADLADADAILVRSATKVTAALMDAAPGLRIIARAGTGVGARENVQAIQPRGRVAPDRAGRHAFLLLLPVGFKPAR